MAMTMEQRIEAAAKARTPYQWSDLTADEKTRELAYAQHALRHAFPDLFDGTAWLAPMELGAADRLRGRMAVREAMDSDLGMSPSDAFGEGFKAVRDAHLSPETDAKVEG